MLNIVQLEKNKQKNRKTQQKCHQWLKKTVANKTFLYKLYAKIDKSKE